MGSLFNDQRPIKKMYHHEPLVGTLEVVRAPNLTTAGAVTSEDAVIAPLCPTESGDHVDICNLTRNLVLVVLVPHVILMVRLSCAFRTRAVAHAVPIALGTDVGVPSFIIVNCPLVGSGMCIQTTAAAAQILPLTDARVGVILAIEDLIPGCPVLNDFAICVEKGADSSIRSVASSSGPSETDAGFGVDASSDAMVSVAAVARTKRIASRFMIVVSVRREVQ